MLSRDDLIDIIVAGLARAEPATPVPDRAIRRGNAASTRRWDAADRAVKAARVDSLGPQGRLFLSEYDIKKRLTPGELRLTIPGTAILSPLVTDWLTLRGIEIVRVAAGEP